MYTPKGSSEMIRKPAVCELQPTFLVIAVTPCSQNEVNSTI